MSQEKILERWRYSKALLLIRYEAERPLLMRHYAALRSLICVTKPDPWKTKKLLQQSREHPDSAYFLEMIEANPNKLHGDIFRLEKDDVRGMFVAAKLGRTGLSTLQTAVESTRYPPLVSAWGWGLYEQGKKDEGVRFIREAAELGYPEAMSQMCLIDCVAKGELIFLISILFGFLFFF
jgi:hypothetical protein